MIVAFWIFGFQLRLVACLEWLTLCPNCGVLPQMLHLAIFHLFWVSGQYDPSSICIKTDRYDTMDELSVQNRRQGECQ